MTSHKRPRSGKAKKPPSKAIQRWDTEGGASKSGPQQEPERKRPEAKKPFSGDFLENPGSAGEMHFSSNQLAKSIVGIATGEEE
jgi:hypothetical protein